MIFCGISIHAGCNFFFFNGLDMKDFYEMLIRILLSFLSRNINTVMDGFYIGTLMESQIM